MYEVVSFIFKIQHAYNEMVEDQLSHDDPSTLTMNSVNPPRPTDSSTCHSLKCDSRIVFIIMGFFFMLVAIFELITNFDQESQLIKLTHDPQSRTLFSQVNTVTLAEEVTIIMYLHLTAVTPFDYRLRKDGLDIQEAAEQDCLYHQTNQQLGKTTSVNNGALSPQAKAIPCGLYTGMFPISSMSLQYNNGSSIPIKVQDLNVFGYEVHNGDTSQQWTDLEGEQFKQWMEQNSALQLAKKIGEIDGPLEGNVTFTIQSNPLPENIEQAWLQLANNQAVSGQNLTLLVFSFIQSIGMFGFAIALHLCSQKVSVQVRELGEEGMRFLNENNVEQSKSPPAMVKQHEL